MGGRGASAGGVGSLSVERKRQFTAGIKNHTKEQNDAAQKQLEQRLEKEYKIVQNAADYIRTGHIKDRNDPWFQLHVESYNALNAQLKFFKKERKRLGK